jgi:hypothetical protein
MASDDSYIYLGYVKGAIAGARQLFSYNVGEHSAGTTGVLYYYLLTAVCSVARAVTPGLPVAASLTLGAYLTSGGLYLTLGALLPRVFARFAGRAQGPAPLEALGIFFLANASYMFLWGVFSGLENPLSALLTLLVADQLGRRAHHRLVALTAAALCATRPELVLTAGLLPLAAAWPGPAGGSDGRGRRLAEACAVFVAAGAAILAPCFLTTGTVLPSAAGLRLGPGLLPSLPGLLGNLTADPEVWRSGWLLLACGMVAAAGLALLHKGARGGARRALLTGLVILLQFVARTALGLHDLNVHARYVSYLWPLYALGFYTLGEALLGVVPRWGAPLRALAGALALGAFAWQAGIFFREFPRDVEEMNAVSVAPARWMARSLDPRSRIIMEPAGAIRVFTDFYLIDAVGLTTDHYRLQGGERSYYGFARRTRADFVFDYPAREAELADPARFLPLMTWTPPEPRFSWGTIGLYAVR